MANSRLERIGTIFTRVTALLKTGAMKTDDTPIWYEVYKRLPPPIEPRYDQPVPKIDVKPIFYEEDRIRALYHKRVKNLRTIDLNSKEPSETQMFIEIYQNLQKSGALDDEKIFETALEMLQEKLPRGSKPIELADKQPSLVSSFTQAKEQQQAVDVKDIFKD